MSQQLFKEFIVLFKLWPVDMTKMGRCLGENLRKEFNKSFRHGEFSQMKQEDLAHWSKVLKDLKPIANNDIAMKYPRKNTIASLGLGRDQCKIIVSNQSLDSFNEEKE